jgi:penicillin amidase
VYCALHNPHTGFAVPLSAVGAGIADAPGIVSGRNREYAWSLTLVGAMAASLYLEQPGVATRAVTHMIAVKKKPSIEETVLWTERGPLLTLPPGPDGQALSLRWVGHSGDAGGTLQALWQLLHSASVDDIRSAARSWSAPAVNLCWAKVEKQNGAYGWCVAGRRPLRSSPASGLFPEAGWLEEYQWKGFIPPDELPEEMNPERGFVVSANQQHAPRNYPHPLSHEYMPPYRARRIEQMIEDTLARGKCSQADAQRIQIDQTSLAALEMQSLILRFVSVPGTDLERTALNLLQHWDGKLAAQSAAAATLKVTESYLITGVAQQLFGTSTGLSEYWFGRGQTPLVQATLSHRRLREVLSGLIHSQKAVARLTGDLWPTLFRQAFSAAVAELKRLQGPHAEHWSWGQLHQLEISYSLIQQPAYKKLPFALRLLKRAFRLSRGPFPLGGDEPTPWQSSYFPVPLAAQQHPRRFWPNAYQPAVRIIAVSGQKLYTCLPGGYQGRLHIHGQITSSPPTCMASSTNFPAPVEQTKRGTAFEPPYTHVRRDLVPLETLDRDVSFHLMMRSITWRST